LSHLHPITRAKPKARACRGPRRTKPRAANPHEFVSNCVVSSDRSSVARFTLQCNLILPKACHLIFPEI
jgi:hypothetical protein